MRTLTWLVGGAVAFAASAVSAQSTPQSHDAHHPAAPTAEQQQAANGGEKCCCEEMMRKMMMEMMQQHQGMDSNAQRGSTPQPQHEH
jgi:hypothetical protein